jgi:4-hydroxy-2-oxoheptanedioate aldolase
MTGTGIDPQPLSNRGTRMGTPSLKARIMAGEPVYGAWLALADADVAELMAHAGYDFLVLDQEHGPGSLETAVDVMRAAAAADCPLVVRVPWNDPVYLKRILDAGASAVMIPMLEDAAAATAAVAACRYPPAGTRGYAAASQRCTRWGKDTDYLARWNDEVLIIGQLESARAAANAAEIAAVDGIDVPFIGINDMAGSIGRLGQLDHPEVRQLVESCEAALRQSGKPLGTVPSAMRTTPELFQVGYTMVAGAVDAMLLRAAAKADVEAQRPRTG